MWCDGGRGNARGAAVAQYRGMPTRAHGVCAPVPLVDCLCLHATSVLSWSHTLCMLCRPLIEPPASQAVFCFHQLQNLVYRYSSLHITGCSSKRTIPLMQRTFRPEASVDVHEHTGYVS